MSELTERANRLREGITPGPWASWKNRQSLTRPEGYIYKGNVVSDVTKQIIVTQTGNAANSEFIAASPQLVADLTTALERVEKLADEWSVISGDLIATHAAQALRDALEGK